MAVKQREYRTVHQDVSVQGEMTAGADPSATLIAAKTGYTVFIQAIRSEITTDAAQSLTFQGTLGTHAPIFEIPASPGKGPQTREFGEEGIALTEGEGLSLVASAAGLAGWYEIDAYRKLTGVITPSQL